MSPKANSLLGNLMQSTAILFVAFFLGSLIPQNRQVTTPAQITIAGYEHVKAATRNKSVRIIDARQPETYKAGHITGAINLPANSPNEKINHMVSPKQTIVYCSDSLCKDSHLLATKLAKAGQQNISIYKEGWEEWNIIEK